MIDQFVQHQPSEGTESEYDLRVTQDNIKRVFDVITDIPLLDGVLLTEVSLKATPTDIPHKLDRAYVGFIVVDKIGSVIVYRDSLSTADVTKFITLKSTANTLVSIWIF